VSVLRILCTNEIQFKRHLLIIAVSGPYMDGRVKLSHEHRQIQSHWIKRRYVEGLECILSTHVLSCKQIPLELSMLHKKKNLENLVSVYSKIAQNSSDARDLIRLPPYIVRFARELFCCSLSYREMALVKMRHECLGLLLVNSRIALWCPSFSLSVFHTTVIPRSLQQVLVILLFWRKTKVYDQN
jgi:hypothetical protein